MDIRLTQSIQIQHLIRQVSKGGKKKKYYEEPEVDMIDILVDDIMKVSGETEEVEEGGFDNF